MLALLLTLLVPDASAARCSAWHSSDELLKVSQLALSRYADDEMPAFYRANAESQTYIPCMSEAVQPSAAAAWYQLQGVQAFLDRRLSDVDHTDGVHYDMDRYFQIARYLDPTLTLDERIAPPGHPMRLAWENALLAPPFGAAPIEGTPRGDVYIDGLESVTLPAERPFIAQLIATNGLPTHTWLVLDLTQAPNALTGRADLTWSRRLSVGAAGAATVATGLWIGTASSYAQYRLVANELAETPYQATAEQRDAYTRSSGRANALGLGAQVATGLALALGVGSVVVRF